MVAVLLPLQGEALTPTPRPQGEEALPGPGPPAEPIGAAWTEERGAHASALRT